MNIIGHEWLGFTRGERMVVLKFAVCENKKRKEKLKRLLSRQTEATN